MTRPPLRPLLVAAALDAAALLAFAAAGRRSHAEDDGPTGALVTALPFLLGVAVAWLVVRAWRSPLRVRTGLAIWALGVPLGLALRRLAFDRGIAPAFVVVALVVTLALLVGWRVVAAAVAARRGW